MVVRGARTRRAQSSGVFYRLPHVTKGLTQSSAFQRIALGYNRLATLPTSFALLSRLRYLNLRNNSFSVFPHVVRLQRLYG